MNHHHRAHPKLASHTTRTRVAVYLIGTSISIAVRACPHTYPAWRHVRRVYRDYELGSLPARPELQHALVDTRAGKFDLLLVDSASQMTQWPHGLSGILADLEGAGVCLRSATQSYLSTTMALGRMTTRLMVLHAEYQREQQRPRREIR